MQEGKAQAGVGLSSHVVLLLPQATQQLGRRVLRRVMYCSDHAHMSHALCFAVVLQDLMMPEVDGLDILRYVRTNTLLEDLPVISECMAPLRADCAD